MSSCMPLFLTEPACLVKMPEDVSLHGPSSVCVCFAQWASGAQTGTTPAGKLGGLVDKHSRCV